MNDYPQMRARMKTAGPITARVLKLTLWSMIGAVALVMGAYISSLFAKLGIYTNTPLWYGVLAHILGAIAGVLCVLSWLYLWDLSLKTKIGIHGLWCGLMGYLLVLSAVGWAIPVLSSLPATSERNVQALVMGTSDLKVPKSGCKHRVYFGPWYRTRGHICVGQSAMIHNNSVFSMRGRGTGWAVWITSVDAVMSSPN